MVVVRGVGRSSKLKVLKSGREKERVEGGDGGVQGGRQRVEEGGAQDSYPL